MMQTCVQMSSFKVLNSYLDHTSVSFLQIPGSLSAIMCCFTEYLLGWQLS